MLVARVLFFLGVVFTVLDCSVRSKNLCLEPGEVFPDQPFQLTVDLNSTEVAIGDMIQISYHLLNTSDKPVGGCPVGWDEFLVINSATKSNRGLVHVSTGIANDDVFRLPAHAMLTWSREIEMPDIGVGEAQLVGNFESGCWLWSGQVRSKPVVIQVTARRVDHG